MATDGSRLRTSQAAQACMICKTRKKKCSKSLPSCGYCTRKELRCVYAIVPVPQNHAPFTAENLHSPPNKGSRPPINIVSSRMIISKKLSADQTTSEADQGQVYLEVHSIIRGTRQFVDDISARYFQSFHRHLPIISRSHFYNKLMTSGAAPTADFSVLLLTICLITHAPTLGYQAGDGVAPSAEQQTLYLTARSLFAQVQVARSASLPLIQASLLLAVYEYTQSRPDDAFVTIAGSARIAYAARIHVRDRSQAEMAHKTGHNAYNDLLLRSEEAANTWWAIVICERTFFSEVTVPDQPLLTAFPGGDARLPIEPQVLDQLDILDPSSLPNIPVSCLTSPKLGGFSRTAQAACLLDQVLKGFAIPDVDSRLLLLDRLDTNLQAFLSLVIPQCQGQSGAFCAAINIAIRALFTLHWHILSQPSQCIRANFKPLEEWHKRSQEALDTVTKMVVDIAETLIAENMGAQTIDAMPPMYPYIARAALRHVRSTVQREDVGWLRSVEDVLKMSIDRYFERWSVDGQGFE